MPDDMTQDPAGGADPVLLDVGDGIGRITLNRPDVGNAFDFALAHALTAALARCAADDQVRCVTITGAGRLFCVGGDIAVMGAAGERIEQTLLDLANDVHAAIRAVADFPKPVVTLVNGPAAGAGYGLALCADLCIAATSASFTPAYARLGLTPDGGASWLLPRLVGLRLANELLLTNRTLSAQEAADHRLVNRVVADEALAGEGAALASRLADGPAHALVETRKLILAGLTSDLSAHLDREARAIAAAGAHPEGREGIPAFIARRRPNFR